MMRFIFILFFSLFTTLLSAVDGTWDGGGGDDNWSTPGNWDANIIANGGGNAYFYNNATPADIDIAVTLDTLTVNTGVSFLFSTTGAGSLTLNSISHQSANKVTITSSEDFSFATAPGTITVTNATGDVELRGLLVPAAQAKNVNIVGPGTVTFAQLAGSELGFNADTVTLANQATFSYVFLFGAGTPSSQNIVLGANTQVEYDGEQSTISTNISGQGVVVISGTKTLAGNNAYTGGTVIQTSSLLIATTETLPTGGNISGVVGAFPGILRFDQDTDGTFTGVMSQSLALQKNGTGVVTISNTQTYTRSTTVNAGTLSVTGALPAGSTVSVVAGATLTGSGSVGPVNNSGTVITGLTATDTLTVNGNFNQSVDTAIVQARVSTNSASLLSVTGTATLQGTLNLTVAPGVYPAGTSFNLINAAGGITGQFTTFNDNDARVWAVAYAANLVTISVTPSSPQVVVPFPIGSLPENPRRVGQYFFENSSNISTASADLTTVANASLAITNQDGFALSLLRLSPITDFGIRATNYQSNLQMAVAIDKQFQSTSKIEKQKQREKEEALLYTNPYGMPQTGSFIQPIGMFYQQRKTDRDLAASRQIPFKAYIYGAGMGTEYVFNSQFVFEGGFGYTRTLLRFNDNFGKADWNSVYIAPFVGWFNPWGFINGMVMGAFNFYEVQRKIVFPGINRTAKSRYNSYDILLRLNAGLRFNLGHDLWLMPESTLNYMTSFVESYTERDAGGINLRVQKQEIYIMQPSVRVRILREFETKNFCFAPNLYAGWLANISLYDDTATARFVDAPASIFFTIFGPGYTTNQMVLGAEYYMQRLEEYELSLNFEADVLSRFEVFTVKLKFELFF